MFTLLHTSKVLEHCTLVITDLLACLHTNDTLICLLIGRSTGGSLPVGLSLGLHLLCEVKRRQILGLLTFGSKNQECMQQAVGC
jgi:hypothetical protein